MRLRTILAAVAAPAIVAGALALAPLSPAASAATYPALTRVHDPGHVTGTMHGRCYLRAGGKLPDPRCTPGSLTPTSAGPSIGSESSKIWGGYVLQAKAGHRFSQVYAEFTVPRGMSRGKVLRDYRSPVSPYYGLAAFWAGLGGWNGAAILEQGGVEAFVTQHGLVQYRAFTEMFPAQPGAIWLPLNYEVNGNDKPLPQAATIHAGDHMAVQVDDDASTLKDTGRSYTIFVMDLTQNRYGFRTERTTAANHGHDQTAEVITEAPGGGPSGRHTGLLNTGTVRYTNAYAGVFGEAMFGLGPRPEWDTTKVTLGHFWLRHPVGHFWVPAYYNKVVETGRLGGYTPPSPKGGGGEGMHSFNTFWNAG
jgi:hypothetical protein